jgi:hypothetical protein
MAPSPQPEVAKRQQARHLVEALSRGHAVGVDGVRSRRGSQRGHTIGSSRLLLVSITQPTAGLSQQLTGAQIIVDYTALAVAGTLPFSLGRIRPINKTVSASTMAKNLRKFVNLAFLKTIDLTLMRRLLERHETQLSGLDLAVFDQKPSEVRKALQNFFAG